MSHIPFTRNDSRYITYYLNQAGGGGNFIGSRIQYGNGVAGIFRTLYRMAMPLFVKGFNIIKPHLKTAASGVASDVVSKIARSAFAEKQKGDGLMVLAKRARKTPPTSLVTSHRGKRPKTKSKRQRSIKKKSFVERYRTNHTSRISDQDIF